MSQSVACIQMTSGSDIAANLRVAGQYIQEAASHGAILIELPEMFALMGMDQMDKVKQAEVFGQGPIQDFLATQATKYGVWIVGGTIPLTLPGQNQKVRAACLVFDDQGQCVTRYDKIHLFDVLVKAGQEERYAESNTIAPGSEVIVIPTPVGRLGLAVCYDVRFPELFREMHKQDVELIALPSAFTYPTGVAHWDVLVRARAIENLAYVLAACQTGVHSNQRRTYGHSMLVNPWGEVVASLGEQPGVLIGDVDLAYLHQLRQEFPALTHRRV